MASEVCWELAQAQVCTAYIYIYIYIYTCAIDCTVACVYSLERVLADLIRDWRYIRMGRTFRGCSREL